MLSNNNNNSKVITCSNYEEFFVLYTDNELSKEEVDMVEAFLVDHPELRVELDLLLQTKLEAEPLKMDKTALLSTAMKRIDLDEEMLMHLDGELPEARVAALEQQLALDETLHLQWNLLQRTKLDPSEKIVFADKEVLYRHTAGVRTEMRFWWRIAAVVALLLTMGILYWMNSGKQHQQPSLAARHLPGAVAPNDPDRRVHRNHEQPTGSNLALAPVRKSNNKNAMNVALKHKQAAQPSRDVQPQLPSQLAASDARDRDRQHSIKQTRFIPSTPLGAVARVDVNPVPIPGSPVTFAARPTYNNTEGSTNETAQLEDHDDRKGSLKGFLRKATRMIEKRTGFGVASSDDESLLVGAVSLKLK